ncbi:L-type lectin-domain containing receptor kinase IX.1-like [Panicum virgatum]|uniref:L-type lectin-domain containing receptor kinase IX.1-like n=1 Tax=Panicum virgatum TaxID=38727 RepID=UPI0019D5638F|nr:L-type lectin-domain containing receptor kinase IX.1-like [Panicum virgatum]
MASRRHLVFALATVLALLRAVAKDDGNILRPWPPDCSTADNYTAGSQYQRNLAELLSRLPAAAGDNGWFYEGSAGAGADEVLGLVMCYADYNATACRDCLSRAPAGITTVCPGSRSVRAMYDACTLRYSDTPPIPAAAADLAVLYIVYLAFPGVSVTSEGLREAWVPLMSELTGGAAASPLRLANGSTPYSSSQEMYGLAQCTRDLNASECARCIGSYVSQLGKLFPNNSGGVVKGYSCYLRYQVAALDITLPPAPAPAPPAPGPSSSSKTGIVIGVSVSVGSVSILMVLSFSAWLLLRWRRRKMANLHEETRAMEDEFEKGTGPKRFRYGELVLATDNFSDRQKLGEGGFGSVYRGFLREMNLHVAIKRVSKGSKQGRKEYASEVRIISRLRHRHLVQLVGWCHGGGDLLLVYELMPNGSLDKHLYSGDNKLSWSLRHKIVLEIASAILYLHQEWEQCVMHRDIKPSNVMLDASFTAKLGDFGLARLVDHARGSHTTVLAGTLGYMDPECRVRGRASAQSDVYSFGVVLLEVACGRGPAVVLGDDAVIHLSRHVSELHGQGSVLDAADPRLGGEFDAREMESVLVAGLWCTQGGRNTRPSIRQVLAVLRFELPLPCLLPVPERAPVVAYTPPAGLLMNSDPSSHDGTNSTSAMSTSV